MTETPHPVDFNRQIAGQIVVVEVKNAKTTESNKPQREDGTEVIVRQIQGLEITYGGYFRRNGAGDLIECHRQVDEGTKAADFRGEEAAEIEVGEVQRSHVAKRVARDPAPGAGVGGGGVP